MSQKCVMWTKPCRKPWKWMLDNFFLMLLPFSIHSLSHYFYTAFLFFGACSEGFLLHDILCFLLILIKMYIHTHNRIIVADTLQISHFTSQWCRIIVPPEIGYPENDYNKSGPRPTTFSVWIRSYFTFVFMVMYHSCEEQYYCVHRASEPWILCWGTKDW